MKWIGDFISLVFPRICAGCGNNLWKHETVICGFCEHHLPETNYHLDDENPVARLFYGRVPLQASAAFLSFNKGNRVQHLIHQLKYKGRKDIGIFLGEWYGLKLRTASPYCTVDAVIPVPLHKKKLMKRGYNQSEQFAVGLAGPLEVPVDRFLLIRTKATETQTRKSRFSRYQNVKDMFLVTDRDKYAGRHLLLVDDVITTGATLEACVAALTVIPGVSVSIACIATARL